MRTGTTGSGCLAPEPGLKLALGAASRCSRQGVGGDFLCSRHWGFGTSQAFYLLSQELPRSTSDCGSCSFGNPSAELKRPFFNL